MFSCGECECVSDAEDCENISLKDRKSVNIITERSTIIVLKALCFTATVILNFLNRL